MFFSHPFHPFHISPSSSVEDQHVFVQRTPSLRLMPLRTSTLPIQEVNLTRNSLLTPPSPSERAEFVGGREGEESPEGEG